jgi:hypothetical protein
MDWKSVSDKIVQDDQNKWDRKVSGQELYGLKGTGGFFETLGFRFQWYPVAITNEMFIWKGKKYQCYRNSSARKLAA